MSTSRFAFVVFALALATQGINGQTSRSDAMKKGWSRPPRELDQARQARLDELKSELKSVDLSDTSRAQSLGLRVSELARELREVAPGWSGRLHETWALRLQRVARFDDAVRHLTEAAAIFRRVPDPYREGAVIVRQGGIHVTLGRYDDALKDFDAAAVISKRLGDEKGLAVILQNRGAVYHRSGRSGEAVVALEKAGKVFLRIGDKRGSADVSMNLGLALNALGRFDDALSSLEAAHRMFVELGDEVSAAKATLNRGLVLEELDRHAEARADFEAAEKALAEAGDRHTLAKARGNLGRLFHILNDYDAAISAYSRALSTFRDLGDEQAVAMCLMNLGLSFSALGRSGSALKSYDDASAVFERMGDDANASSLSGHRGRALAALGRSVEALAAFEEAARFYERVNDERSLADLAIDRSSLFGALGREDLALLALNEASAYYERDKNLRVLAGIGINRGNLHLGRGELPAAAAAFTHARKTFSRLGDRRSAALAEGQLALVAMKRKDLDAALAGYEAERKEYDDIGAEHARARVTLNIGLVRGRMGHHEDALREFTSAATALDRAGDRAGFVQATMNRAQALADLDRRADALQTYFDAIRVLKDIVATQAQPLGTSFSWRLRHERYQTLSTILSIVAAAEDGSRYIPEAYEAYQVFHGLGMAQLIAERSEQQGRRVPAALAERLREAKERCLAADALADSEEGREARKSGRAELDSLIARIRAHDPSYAAASYPRPADLSEVQAQLPKNAALIEYVVFEDSSYAFVITSSNTWIRELGPTAPLRKEAHAVARALRTPRMPARPLGTLLERLSRRVIAPVLEGLDLAEVKTVIVSPADALCFVPVEALLLHDPTPNNPLPYVLTGFDVTYIHSGTVLRDLIAARPRRTSEAPTFIGFGYPYYGKRQSMTTLGRLVNDTDSPALPGTAEEVLRVARIFADGSEEHERLDDLAETVDDDDGRGRFPVTEGKRFSVHLGRAASESTLADGERVRRADVVHVACHARADPESPEMSHLRLSAPAGEAESDHDGLVFLHEVRDLELTCELLVLSACETHAGGLRPLEGVTGLSRAGFAAGASAVVCTLWAIDDEQAPELVEGFYSGWLKGKATRAHAMAEAKRAALEAGVPVGVWAAYMLWDAGI